MISGNFDRRNCGPAVRLRRLEEQLAMFSRPARVQSRGGRSRAFSINLATSLLDWKIIRSERRCGQTFFVHQIRHVGTAPPKTNGIGFGNLRALNNNCVAINFSVRRHKVAVAAGDRKMSQRLAKPSPISVKLRRILLPLIFCSL